MTTAPTSDLQVLFADNFDSAPSASNWDYNHFSSTNNPSFYGRTQQRQSLPTTADISNGVLKLKLDTFNPTGFSFFGSELISKQTFTTSLGGVAFQATARLDSKTAGIVGGIFGYSFNTATQKDNELDYELLGKDAAANISRAETNVYSNQSLGPGNPQFVPVTDVTAFHTYRMEWYPDRVRWFIDGQLVREDTTHVPLGAMALHLNIWAPAQDWSDAYSSALQPTATASANASYFLDIDFVSVTRLAGGRNIALGAAPQTVIGGTSDTITGGAGSAVVDARVGPESIVGGNGAITVFGGIGDTIVAGSGDAYIDATSGGVAMTVGSAGTDLIIGTIGNTGSKLPVTIGGGAAAVQIQGLGKGDQINFASQIGNATVNGTAGGITMSYGSGAATVYSGAGDLITLGAGNQYVDGTLGGAKIGVGSAGGSDTIIGALAPVGGAGVDTLIGGAAAVQIQGLGKGDQINFASQTGSATVNGTAGGITMSYGSGAATIYSGAGDLITLGAGNQYVDGTLGGAKIGVGSAGGSDTIIGTLAPVAGAGVDTLIGGAAAVQIQGLGKGDQINFASQTGNAIINATAGNIAVSLGAGNASVYAGAGDTITLGSVSQYVDARGGTAGTLIKLGTGGTDNVIGSTVAGAAGVTINGASAAALNYNTGGGNDLINLTSATGAAVINGFGFDTGAINDTIIAGNGGDSVWGGQGNRIGVGTGASGSDLFTHATTIASASVGFGSNDSVVAATYGNTAGAATVNGALAGASSAKVTVSGFAEAAGTPTDYLFYQNETAATTAAIVTTSGQVLFDGLASTQLTLPDGTVMTLIGVPQADFNTAFFKL